MKALFSFTMATAIMIAGCGYRPVHSAEPERFAVVLATTNVPDAVTTDEVLAGVRDELARSGSLKSGEAYPRCEIEVLRGDESSEGIAAVPNAGGTLVPEARATRVGVVARAWIVREKNGTRERDTGDVRAIEFVSVAPDARAATFRQVDSQRAAARHVGQRLGVRLLGLPSSSD